MKGQIFVTVAAVLVLTPSGMASQQPGDTDDLRILSDYLRYAALNNAGLKATFEQWKAAMEQVPQAKALPDPRFTYGRFIEEVETRVGPQRNKLGISQMFPWFGKIEARTQAAGAAAKAARQRYEAAKLKLFFEVKNTFHEYAYLAKAIEIARENLELIEDFEQVALTKYIGAAAGHPDIVRAQVELAKLEDQLRTLEGLREPIAARLNAVLNRRGPGPLPWPQQEKHRVIEIDRGQIKEILTAQNPELRALDFELESAKSRVELAKKKFYPEIGVGIDWIQTDDALMAGTRDSGKDPIVLMFSMNVPIWRESYKAAEIQAKALARKAQHQKTETKNTLIARVERVLYDFEDSERKRRLYGGILVPKAQELVNASEAAYQGGTIDFLSLIDAQRTLLKFELLRERAVTDNRQKLAELEMLVGAELNTADKADDRE
ncbi:MAG: sulfonate ABC transporter substrate-binding protein [Planctomycetes bacterium B3_Pla]|nr:MAG: sulfonate ABC transporter substrate-binding protein [Planctomycetes bacterium B3_Pla]